MFISVLLLFGPRQRHGRLEHLEVGRRLVSCPLADEFLLSCFFLLGRNPSGNSRKG